MTTLRALACRPRLDALCDQRSRAVICRSADPGAAPRARCPRFRDVVTLAELAAGPADGEARALLPTRRLSSNPLSRCLPSRRSLRRGAPEEPGRRRRRRCDSAVDEAREDPASLSARAAGEGTGSAAGGHAGSPRRGRGGRGRLRFKLMLDQIRALLQAGPVTLETLPPRPRRRLDRPRTAAPACRCCRATVGPTTNSFGVSRRRSRSSRRTPPAHRFRTSASGDTVVEAFLQAGVYSVVAIIAAAGGGAATGPRRGADDAAGAAERAADIRDLRSPRPAAQLHQHHRPAAAVRHWRRLQHLLRAWRGAPARRRCCSRA